MKVWSFKVSSLARFEYSARGVDKDPVGARSSRLRAATGLVWVRCRPPTAPSWPYIAL